MLKLEGRVTATAVRGPWFVVTEAGNGSVAMSGIIVLNKPRDTSSAWYVYRLRPILEVRRIGHAGSLDPFAEGVLIACVDKATRLAETLMDLPKHYEATVQLGVTSASYDTEQPIEPYPDAREPTEEELREAMRRFQGHILQVPPAFSAIQVGGVRAYNLARGKESIEIKPRAVRVYSLQLREYAWPWLKFDVVCGRGTYIRALVRDIGEALQCGGVCTELRRVAVGPFDLSQAVGLRGMSREQLEERIIPREQVVEVLRAYKRRLE